MKSSENGQVGQALAMILQVGISMMTPIFLCAALGVWLDNHFHVQIWFLVLVILGVAAGFRNTYYLLKGFIAKPRGSSHSRTYSNSNGNGKPRSSSRSISHNNGYSENHSENRPKEQTHHRLEEAQSWEKPEKRS